MTYNLILAHVSASPHTHPSDVIIIVVAAVIAALWLRAWRKGDLQ